MLVLVGPESVTRSCLGSSCSGRSPDLHVGKSSVLRGVSRVRLSRAYEGKLVRCSAGIERRNTEKLSIRAFSRESDSEHRQGPRTSTESQKVLRSDVQGIDDTTEVLTSGSKEDDMLSRWRVETIGAVTSIMLVFGPAVNVGDMVVTFSDNAAMASSIPIAQMTRPGTMLLDKLVGGFKSSKVLDKMVTVVSGQVIVKPDDIEKDLKEIMEGPESFEKWRNGLLDNALDSIGSAVDVITHLTPEGVQQSVSTSFTGLFEVGAERFAAFELQSLVGLTERWLIYLPLVVLPMAWQMRARSNAAAADALEREGRRLIISKENDAKADRVRRELERIRLKASLLETLKSAGEVALRALQNGPQPMSSEITDIVNQLKVMNPGYEVQLSSQDPGSTIRSGSANDAFSDIPATPQLDGDWSLVYVSQSFLNRDVPQVSGVEIHNPRQQVWNQGSSSTMSIDADVLGSSLLMAKNVAELRLGPLGLVEVAVQGSWENLRNGQAGLVSFDTFLVRPIEILGTLLGDDLPPISLPLPQQLQSTAEWEVLYLDETLRVNQDQQGEIFIFTRKA